MKFSNNPYFDVVPADEIEISFDCLLGLEKAKEELEEIITYSNLTDRYLEIGLVPRTKYIIGGPKGCGKKSLILALAKEIDLPIIVIYCSKLLNSRIIKDAFKKLFSFSKKLPNFVLYFDSIEYLQSDEDTFMQFYNELIEFLHNYEKSICFLSSNEQPILIPPFILDEDEFEKTISISEPELQIREQLFKKFCSAFPVDEINYNALAKQSGLLTGGYIKKIVKEAIYNAVLKNASCITQEMLEDALSELLYGKKKKKTTDNERKMTAYHEAGHAVVGYYSGITNFSKIDIIHRDESLGMTVSEFDDNKYTWLQTDYEAHILLALGGLCSERYLLNVNSSGVVGDLLKATKICINMICTFGMDDEFGPVSLLDVSEDEPSYIKYPKLAEISDLILQQRMKDYLIRATDILLSHTKQLEALANALLESEVISGDEMIEIFNNC